MKIRAFIPGSDPHRRAWLESNFVYASEKALLSVIAPRGGILVRRAATALRRFRLQVDGDARGDILNQSPVGGAPAKDGSDLSKGAVADALRVQSLSTRAPFQRTTSSTATRCASSPGKQRKLVEHAHPKIDRLLCRLSVLGPAIQELAELNLGLLSRPRHPGCFARGTSRGSPYNPAASC